MHIRRFPMREVLEHMCETCAVTTVPTLLVHDRGPAGIFDFDAGTVSYRSNLSIEQIVRTLAHLISHWHDCEKETEGRTAEEKLYCTDRAFHHFACFSANKEFPKETPPWEHTAQESAALYMTLHGDRWIEEFRGK